MFFLSMDENSEPTKPSAETPTTEVAQLMKILDAQRGIRLEHSEGQGMPRGDAFRYGSLVVIVVFAFGSVMVMDWMVTQLPRPAHTGAAAIQANGTKLDGTAAPQPGR